MQPRCNNLYRIICLSTIAIHVVKLILFINDENHIVRNINIKRLNIMFTFCLVSFINSMLYKS